MKRTNENSISLNKFISDTGRCSRREADRLITEGRVSVNDRVGKLGNRVYEGDVVHLDGEVLQNNTKTIYIAFNKPLGIVCTTDKTVPNNIISFIGHDERLFPIGRLDKSSEGLIFLTNDGNIVNKILRAGNKHEKEYVVTVNKSIHNSFIKQMSEGVEVKGKMTQPCEVVLVDKYTFRIILTQGLNRQIRRMCEALDHDVTSLYRTRIMNVELGRLKSGKWRKLTKPEMAKINQMIETSSKTEEASKQKSRRAKPRRKSLAAKKEDPVKGKRKGPSDAKLFFSGKKKRDYKKYSSRKGPKRR